MTAYESLIKLVALRSGCSAFVVKKVLKTLRKAIIYKLQRNEKVVIPKVGVLQVVPLQGKKGFDFIRGVPMELPAYLRIRFIPAPSLKRLLRQATELPTLSEEEVEK